MNAAQPDVMLSTDWIRGSLDTGKEIHPYFFGQEEPCSASLTLPNGNSTHIGQGINVITASGPNTESLISSLLKRDIYNSFDYIDCYSVNLAESGSEVSDRFEEVFQSAELSAGLKTGGKMAFFTGGISAKYGTSGKLSENAKFYNAVASVETEKQALNSDYMFGEDIRGIVNPNVLKNINNPANAPETLFNIYGTHLITSSSNGGCIQVHGIYNSSEKVTNQAFQAAVDFLCCFISLHADTKFSEEHKQILSSTSIKAKSYGGDVSVVAGMQSFSDIAASFGTWAKSIRDNNSQVLARIYSYMPIWELAESESRQSQIKAVFTQLANKNCRDISQYFQTLPSQKAVALASLIPTMQGIPRLAYVAVRPGLKGREEDLIIPYYPVVYSVSTFDMIFHSDNTVSFRVRHSQKFLSVHYNSMDASHEYGDVSQLYANALAIDKRQKFILEPDGKQYRIKSAFNQRYIASHTINGNAVCLFADQDYNNALLFDLKEL